MAVMEATTSILFSHHHSSLSHISFSPISKLSLSSKPSLFPIHLHFSISTLSLTHKFPLYPSNSPSLRAPFELCASSNEVALLENPSETQEGNQKRKLYVVNLPWSLSADDLKNAFTECGTVKDVELIKNKDGKKRGFAFVTMASGDEAKAVVDKFHLKELSGRTIKVEYAKKLKKPRPQPPVVVPVQETRHKLYVSNLQWKVRSTHLRDFFSANFKPVSTRVVFESASGRSAGYGFVSFSTREEAEAVITSLNGKELLGRPVSLKFSEKTVEDKVGGDEQETDKLNESVSEVGEEEEVEGQPEES